MKECNLKRRQFLKSVALSAATIGLSHQPFAARAEAAALNTEYLQKIPHRPLGNTGASVPILHIGTAQTLDQEYDKILHLLFREASTGSIPHSHTAGALPKRPLPPLPSR